jgi:hypothetical protein
MDIVWKPGPLPAANEDLFPPFAVVAVWHNRTTMHANGVEADVPASLTVLIEHDWNGGVCWVNDKEDLRDDDESSQEYLCKCDYWALIGVHDFLEELGEAS